jgi:hypothetical protein
MTLFRNPAEDLLGVPMKKNVLLSLGITLATVAVTSAATYAVKRNGGLKRTSHKLRRHPVVAGAIDKLGTFKQRFAANDTTDHSAAA